MLYYKICIILLLALSDHKVLARHKENNKCVQRVNLFLNKEQNFLGCILEKKTFVYHRPCEMCLNDNVDVEEAYYNLTKEVDNNGEACFDIYIQNEVLRTIPRIHENFKNIWSDANCPSCYDSFIVGKKNLTISKHVTEFNEYIEKLHNCTKSHIKNYCTSCDSDYEHLKSLFILFKERSNNNVCYDVESIYNATYKEWLPCKKNVAILSFTIGSSLFMFLMTATFYITLVLYTQRRERMNEIIYSLARPEENVSSDPAASSSAPVHDDPSTSSHQNQTQLVIEGPPKEENHSDDEREGNENDDLLL